ncbi:MAG: hypothetical protein PHU66_04165, partial [Bacteroidaceae bacterium]|nr:hypothetical protein [Bacteroidaceae bacterium]
FFLIIGLPQKGQCFLFITNKLLNHLYIKALQEFLAYHLSTSPQNHVNKNKLRRKKLSNKKTTVKS